MRARPICLREKGAHRYNRYTSSASVPKSRISRSNSNPSISGIFMSDNTGYDRLQTPGARKPAFSFVLGSSAYDRRLRSDSYDPQRPSVRQCRSTAPLHSRSIRGEELKCRSSTPTFGSTTKLQHILLALIGAGMAGARMASSAGTGGAVGAVGSTMTAADKLQERISSVNSSGSGDRNGGSPASSPSSRMNSTVSPSATLGNQGASSSIKTSCVPFLPSAPTSVTVSDDPPESRPTAR